MRWEFLVGLLAVAAFAIPIATAQPVAKRAVSSPAAVSIPTSAIVQP